MKNLIIVFTIATLSFNLSFASVTPESDLSLIADAKVEVTLMDENQKDFFHSAEFDMGSERLDFVTKEEVSFIQIYTQSGELQYQLPVMSNKVKLSKKMFDKGSYKIAFLTQNDDNIRFTSLKIN